MVALHLSVDAGSILTKAKYQVYVSHSLYLYYYVFSLFFGYTWHKEQVNIISDIRYAY